MKWKNKILLILAIIALILLVILNYRIIESHIEEPYIDNITQEKNKNNK